MARGTTLSPTDHEKMIKMYQDGKDISELASIFSRTKQSVYWWLKKGHVDIRKKPPAKPYVHKTGNAEPLEETVLGELPDVVLFRHINYAIP